MFKQIFLIIQIARLCHEANREYCISLGDDSQPTWEDAPYWQKISAVKGVLLHLYYYPAVNPEKSHEAWMREKVADGWVYGEKKDPEAKTHPCLVPYMDLPIAQRLKDTLFINIIHAVVNTVGKDHIQENLIDTGKEDERGRPILISEIEPSDDLIEQVKKLCEKPEVVEENKPEGLQSGDTQQVEGAEEPETVGEVKFNEPAAGSGEPSPEPKEDDPDDLKM